MISKEQSYRWSHKLGDMLLTVVAFVAAYFTKKYALPQPWGGLSLEPNYYLILAVAIVSYIFVSDWVNLHRSYMSRKRWKVAANVLKTVAGMALFNLAALYVFKLEGVSRLMMGIFYIFEAVLLLAGHSIMARIYASHVRKTLALALVILVGTRERAIGLIEQSLEDEHHGVRVVGCVDPDPAKVGETVHGPVKVLGTVEDLEHLIREMAVDEVVFAMPLREIPNVGEIMSDIEAMGVLVRILPDWQIYSLMYKPNIASIHFDTFLGVPSMALDTTSRKYMALSVKNIMDYGLSGLLLALLSPLFLLVALCIKIASPGPVFFKQERVGRHGRLFKVFKFRTMVIDAEKRLAELREKNEMDGPVFKIDKDPRIIPWVGTFLRRTSLDELPQLINVVKGEMSFVGPRPPLAEEVAQYEISQRRRLSMKPGLTCLWQVAPNRNQISFEKWMKLDLMYIDNWSLLMDLKIMLNTVKVVVTAQGR